MFVLFFLMRFVWRCTNIWHPWGSSWSYGS